MKKFLIGFFLFFLLFLETTTLDIYSYTPKVVDDYSDIHIISRAEWGADETFRYLDHAYWVDKLKKAEEAKKTYTKEDYANFKKESDKRNEIDNYIINNFKEDNELLSTIKDEKGHKLAWPIQKTKYLKGIVIHHTDTFYETSLDSMRKIYKFHALTRGWGDIGYNYLIGYDGEIYEGRAGGDYTVGAHALRNNRSTIGIALIGYYHDKELNEKQKKSLEKLVKYLIKKYGIDLSKKFDYHKDCVGKDCSFYIKDEKTYPIVGHRDAGHTSCPGEKVYAYLDQLRSNNLDFSRGLNYVANKGNKKSANYIKTKEKLSKYDKQKLLNTLIETEAEIDKLIDIKTTADKIKKTNLFEMKEILFDLIYNKNKIVVENKKKNFDDTRNIKIKLSYPIENQINISDGVSLFNIKINADKTKLLLGGRELVKLTIKSSKRGYLDIVSWKRSPAWDTSGLVNDNKFRGNLIVYVKNQKIVVVNELSITNYLKGLGEVGNLDNPEKIKTIIVTARTYARYYIEKSRKFPGEDYDGVDDPDSFQNYIGYSFEKRSPNISKIVEDTKDKIITYKGFMIKPWYFSKSDGKTISYLDYCKNNAGKIKGVEFCVNESKKYPYLISVKDPGGKGLEREGHGVGVSGIGATYLSNRGWSYSMIIEYFLNGVNVG